MSVCACCLDKDRHTAQVRGVELCDECAKALLGRPNRQNGYANSQTQLLALVAELRAAWHESNTCIGYAEPMRGGMPLGRNTDCAVCGKSEIVHRFLQWADALEKIRTDAQV